MTNKYLDYSGVESFWDRICKRFDNKLDSVDAHDDSIRIYDGNEIAVQISSAEDNVMQLKTSANEKGLFVPKNHKLIFGAGEAYEYDGSKEVTIPVYTGDYIE